MFGKVLTMLQNLLLAGHFSQNISSFIANIKNYFLLTVLYLELEYYTLKFGHVPLTY